jgi:hypothetical protein
VYNLALSIKTKTMKQLTKSQVAPDLKPGDVVEFTNSRNFKQVLIVVRADEKSWYDMFGGRNSYGTLKQYMKYTDFKIISNN